MLFTVLAENSEICEIQPFLRVLKISKVLRKRL